MKLIDADKLKEVLFEKALYKKHFYFTYKTVESIIDSQTGETDMAENEKQRNPMTFTIEELNMSNRSTFCLRRHGVKTLGELCDMTESEVKNIRNMGTKSLQEIKDKLAENGLHLCGLEKPRARNTFDGISAGKHRQAVESLKVLNQYCESTFDNTDGCEHCVFRPADDGQSWCPLRGSFTPQMFLSWSRRANELDKGEVAEWNQRQVK